ncbi:hypothetical protein SA2016_4109 (plasmid) [Sinomonas atrocyanea]|uniref:Uncharacterized protein n=1 Tax=Sinomonas atrocyanea TaxID=37927 RepID=A0A127A732_9MICC|nr:MarR family winged helix-turn-helix transcriptional regulator [Sinomonas atrocyanea]AMM34761.1 hypothetical protein SA2016_4109 [Sinomonas atrocyanea]GEB66238.1 hypothetical protein SAT01_36860 [Sinomonas atrocyanea]
MAEMAGPGSAARAIRRLMQVGDVVRQSYARRLGLGRSDYLALAHIYCEGPIQPRELGTRLGMGSGTLTPCWTGSSAAAMPCARAIRWTGAAS